MFKLEQTRSNGKPKPFERVCSRFQSSSTTKNAINLELTITQTTISRTNKFLTLQNIIFKLNENISHIPGLMDMKTQGD